MRKTLKQILILKREFKKSNCIKSLQYLNKLKSLTGLTAGQIRCWFATHQSKLIKKGKLHQIKDQRNCFDKGLGLSPNASFDDLEASLPNKRINSKTFNDYYCIRALDETIPYLIDIVIKDANDSLNNQAFSKKKKQYLQQLCIYTYLGIITGLRSGATFKSRNFSKNIDDNYGIRTIRVKHIQIDCSTYTLVLNYKSKTNIINQKVSIQHPIIFDLLYGIYANKVHSNQRIFDYVTPEALNKYLSSIIPTLKYKILRKFIATVSLYSSYSESNLKINIDKEAHYKNIDIHNFFVKNIFQNTLDLLQHISVTSLQYYIDPNLIVAIFNNTIIIKDSNLKKKLLQNYISYFFSCVSIKTKNLNLDLVDYFLNPCELIKNNLKKS